MLKQRWQFKRQSGTCYRREEGAAKHVVLCTAGRLAKLQARWGEKRKAGLIQGINHGNPKHKVVLHRPSLSCCFFRDKAASDIIGEPCTMIGFQLFGEPVAYSMDEWLMRRRFNILQKRRGECAQPAFNTAR